MTKHTFSQTAFLSTSRNLQQISQAKGNDQMKIDHEENTTNEAAVLFSLLFQFFFHSGLYLIQPIILMTFQHKSTLNILVNQLYQFFFNQ